MTSTPVNILLMQPNLEEGSDRAKGTYRFHVWSPEQPMHDIAPSIRGLVTNGALGAPREVLDALPNLEIIAVCGVGFDKVDLEICRLRNIKVATARDILSADVADLAMSLTLGVMRRVVEADRYIRAGRWVDDTHFPLATSLTGKRMGIVGMGRIGAAIARRAIAFDMEVAYHNRRVVAHSDHPYHNTLLSIAAWSDVLVLCLPGGMATRHIVDKKVLEALGPRGYLINVARGSVVDEKALIAALQRKEIAGAGLDVFEDEPRVPASLAELDNVVLQPHIASATRDTRAAMADLVYQNFDACFQNQALLTPLAF